MFEEELVHIRNTSTEKSTKALYNWGPQAPNPKSSWNTLDFEPTQIIKNPDGTIKEILRTSPFAYNSNNNIDRNNYA